MIQIDRGPLISHPTKWVLVFDEKAATHWVMRLVPGRYKHVRAYGYVPFLHVWLFVDANFSGIEIMVAADGEPANALAASWAAGCDLVVMPRRSHERRSLSLAASGWCVPVIKRLIGLNSGALRPDALFADCLQNGGQFHGQQQHTPSPSGDDDGSQRGRPAVHRACA